MTSTVRITLTDEVEKTLKFLEGEYVALNRVEVIKLALSEFYNNTLQRKKSKSISQLLRDLPPTDLSDDEAMEIAIREIKRTRLGEKDDPSDV